MVHVKEKKHKSEVGGGLMYTSSYFFLSIELEGRWSLCDDARDNACVHEAVSLETFA